MLLKSQNCQVARESSLLLLTRCSLLSQFAELICYGGDSGNDSQMRGITFYLSVFAMPATSRCNKFLSRVMMRAVAVISGLNGIGL